MISSIRKLCGELAAATLTAGERAARLGTQLKDLGGNAQVEFVPNDKAFTKGSVVREWGKQEEGGVTLIIANPHSLSLAELTRTFGRPRADEPEHFDSPVRRSWRLKDVPSGHPVSLLATVDRESFITELTIIGER
jgi:hypothetical protein